MDTQFLKRKQELLFQKAWPFKLRKLVKVYTKTSALLRVQTKQILYIIFIENW